MGYLKVTRSELYASFSVLKPSHLLSQREHNKRVLDAGKRHHDFVLQRFFGSPLREVVPIDKDLSRLMCPNIQVIRKYIPAIGHLVDLPVPCGRCFYCLHKKQNALIFRLVNHAKLYKNFIYVTLTYSDDFYIDSPGVAREDITKFIKRFRKEFADRSFSYYMVCERGDLRDRLHFHLLIFWNGLASKDYVCNLVRSKWYGKVRNLSSLSDLFSDGLDTACVPSKPIGIVYIDDCRSSDTHSNAIASYVSKYVSDGTKKVMFRSWSHGLGVDILSVDYDLVQKMMYLRRIQYMPSDTLYSIGVPQYYKNKIFTQSERDCMFMDYLLSDEYKQYVELCSDSVALTAVAQIYAFYEERSKNAYRLRCQKKAKKLRLL